MNSVGEGMKPTATEMATLKKAYGIAQKYKMGKVSSALEETASGFFDFLAKPVRSVVRGVKSVVKPVVNEGLKGVRAIGKQALSVAQDVQDVGKQALQAGIATAAQNASTAVAAANPLAAATVAVPALLRRGRGRPKKATHLKGMGMAIGE